MLEGNTNVHVQFQFFIGQNKIFLNFFFFRIIIRKLRKINLKRFWITEVFAQIRRNGKGWYRQFLIYVSFKSANFGSQTFFEVGIEDLKNGRYCTKNKKVSIPHIFLFQVPHIPFLVPLDSNLGKCWMPKLLKLKPRIDDTTLYH